MQWPYDFCHNIPFPSTYFNSTKPGPGALRSHLGQHRPNLACDSSDTYRSCSLAYGWHCSASPLYPIPEAFGKNRSVLLSLGGNYRGAVQTAAAAVVEHRRRDPCAAGTEGKCSAVVQRDTSQGQADALVLANLVLAASEERHLGKGACRLP